MANTRSAKKSIKVHERKRQRNQRVRTSVKSAFRKAIKALEPGETEDAGEAARRAYSAMDKAVSKGVIHRNKADRKKSRLAKRVNAKA